MANGGARPIDDLLATLVRDQRVNLGIGDVHRRGWFRAQVVSHDVAAGGLVLTYLMDRRSDRPLAGGQRVVVSATRADDETHSASMIVETSSAGPQSTVHLRMADSLQAEDDRRNQPRAPVQIHASRARRWIGGAWRELDAMVVDLSSHGMGLRLTQEVHVGDRLSLSVPLDEGGADLRLTLEIRHVRPEARLEGAWRAGGRFRNLEPADHERVVCFIFAELRSRRGLYNPL